MSIQIVHLVLNYFKLAIKHICYQVRHFVKQQVCSGRQCGENIFFLHSVLGESHQ
jgi:hypothetical protein